LPFNPDKSVSDDSAERPNQPAAPANGEVDVNTSNRAADRFQIFESVALERLQAGSDSTKPAAFLPLPVRLTAIAAAAIAGIGVVWSVLARVPVQVNGTAAIVPSSGMSTLVAPTSGHLRYQVNGLGPNTLPAAQQRNNQLLSRFWIQEARVFTSKVGAVRNLDILIQAALSPTQGQRLVLPEDLPDERLYDRPGSQQLISYPEGTVLARVVDPMAHQELNGALLSALPTVDLQQRLRRERLRRSGQYRNLGGIQQGQRQAIARELQERRALYQRLQGLWKQGFIPGTQLLEEQTRINGLQNQLLSADSSQLSTRINSQDLLDQSQQAYITDVDSRNRLESQLITFLTRTSLFVPNTGFYLLAKFFKDDTLVRQGEEVLTYTTKPAELPQVVPVFLDGTAAQQVNEGMSVLLTPRGISRAEFGGIRGTVNEVNKLPLLGEGVFGAVGSRSLANSIQQMIPSPYLIWVKLDQAEPAFCRQALSRRCYRWSSGRLPPHPVRLATLADVQITTTYRRPVEFVMPALRKALGLVVDNK
jgi:hypothetical protein